MKRVIVLLLLLLCLVPPVSAQQRPITWTIVPGYGGTFKAGAWIPVTVTVANSGNDLRGQLVWRWNNGGTRFAQSIDLPRGAQKEVVFPVVADTFGGDATLELLDGQQVVASERVRYNQVDASTLVVGVLSEESDALPDVAGLANPMGSSTVLVRLEPTALPERWELLQSLDVLFVHRVDTTAWSDAQRQALALWIADGGQLILGGDRATTSSGVGALLPAATDGATTQVPLAPLRSAFGWTTREADASLRALLLRPLPGADILSATADGTPMVVRRSHGSGMVLQTAFELTALSTQGNPVQLWDRLLPRSGMPPQWQQIRSNGEWVLRESLALPALRLPSLWTLLAFLGLYVVVVGPVNYLALRRVDRREWAYLTIPITVMLFALGAYGYGTLGRGGVTSVNSLSFVRAASGSDVGQSWSYVGVFSPVRREYTVRLEDDVLVSNVFAAFDARAQALQVTRGEASVDVPSFLVDVGALRPLLVERQVPAPEVVVSLLRDGASQARVEIENRGTQPLADAAILVDGNVQKIDDIGPGERRTIAIDPGRFGADDQFQPGGTIRRSSAINALRSSFFMPMPEFTRPVMPGQPMPDVAVEGQVGQSVMLIAWASEPQVGLSLNGVPADVQGETLYFWPAAEVR